MPFCLPNRLLFAPRPDPVTGDVLSFKERLAWQIQGCFRQPWVILGLNLLTVAWWTHGPALGDPDLNHWNVLASLLAIDIEWLVGTSMLGQTKRDAVILRRLRDGEKRQEELLAGMQELLAREEQEIAHVAVIPLPPTADDMDRGMLP